ncbi:hypothetical protein C5167_027196 [Papaver somniferum]|nr:hypothetical protein C5167_027196 [Papaver somniferum]
MGEILQSKSNRKKWSNREGNFAFLIEKLHNSRGDFIRASNKALYVPTGRDSYGWKRFNEHLNKLIGHRTFIPQRVPLISDSPGDKSSQQTTRPLRTFCCIAYGRTSWNQVAKEITTKLQWNRYLELKLINDSLASFQPNNDEEWRSCWKPIKWKYRDTIIEIKRWIDEDDTINSTSFNLAQHWIRIKGLPVQLWSKKNFEIIGDRLGGLAEG